MTLSTQFATMLAMISMGILFGAALDTYNRFLQRSKRKSWLVFINDILFWLLQGLLVFYILYQVNQGEVRFYIFIALVCGFAAYQSLFKSTYLKWLEKLISFAISIYHFIVKLLYVLLYKPIYLLITTLISFILMVGRGLYRLFIWLIHLSWSIIKICLLPLKWILLLFWKLTPKKIKKIVEKLYNRLAGKINILKNTFNTWIKRWKK